MNSETLVNYFFNFSTDIFNEEIKSQIKREERNVMRKLISLTPPPLITTSLGLLDSDGRPLKVQPLRPIEIVGTLPLGLISDTKENPLESFVERLQEYCCQGNKDFFKRMIDEFLNPKIPFITSKRIEALLAPHVEGDSLADATKSISKENIEMIYTTLYSIISSVPDLTRDIKLAIINRLINLERRLDCTYPRRELELFLLLETLRHEQDKGIRYRLTHLCTGVISHASGGISKALLNELGAELRKNNETDETNLP